MYLFWLWMVQYYGMAHIKKTLWCIRAINLSGYLNRLDLGSQLNDDGNAIKSTIVFQSLMVKFEWPYHTPYALQYSYTKEKGERKI